MSERIKISELNEQTYLHPEDFFAIVDSGSVGSATTYRTALASIDNWNATSGSTLSASWASASIEASHSILGDTASYLYPDRVYQATASWANTASWALNAISSSWADRAGSSSYAVWSDTASFAWYAPTASLALTAISASHSITSSFSHQSATASHATTAYTSSYVVVGAGGSAGGVTGMVSLWSNTAAPPGWLICTGSVYDPLVYTDLAAVIGTNFGRLPLIHYTIRPESNAYGYGPGFANDGYIQLYVGDGGSGLYTFTWGGGGVTSVTSGSGHAVTYAGLTGNVTYTVTIKDVGVPDDIYATDFALGFYVGCSWPATPTTTTLDLNIVYGPYYRLPNFTYYYPNFYKAGVPESLLPKVGSGNSMPFYNGGPLVYIIKT